MSDWLTRFAEKLDVPIGIDGADRNKLLDLARDVAHGTERKNAPLATYIAGLFVGASVASGNDAKDALTIAVETAERLNADQLGGSD